VIITVICNLWVPSSGDRLFLWGAISRPPHLAYTFRNVDKIPLKTCPHLKLDVTVSYVGHALSYALNLSSDHFKQLCTATD